MENLVPALYASFGRYTNQNKMLPNIIDGLLPAHKRMLLGGHMFCRNEFTKTPSVVGRVIANWHPHAESVDIAEWAVQNGFMDGSGSWGSLFGAEPSNCAAMRYTSIRANAFIEEIAFKYIDHVPWKEDDLQPEPVVIPTMIPFCLMAKIERSMIAFGFKSEIPVFNIKDLIKRSIWLAGGKKGKEPLIQPNISNCSIDYDEQAFRDLLTTGKTKFNICGKYEVDENRKSVAIKSWSPRTNFATIINRIDKFKKYNLMTNGDVGFIDESSNNTGVRCVLEVTRQRNVSDAFVKLVEAVESVIRSTITYNIYVVDEKGNPKLAGVDEMLIKAYAYHKWAFKNYLNNNIKLNTEKLIELQAIEKMRPYLSNALKQKDSDLVCEELAKKTGINLELIKSIVDKHRIKKLMTVSTDITELKTEIDQLNNNLTNIDKSCEDEYKTLLGKIK